MVRSALVSLLSKSPNLKKALAKVALGFILPTFLLGIQPALPFTSSQFIVRAQAEQTQTVVAEVAPVTFQLPHEGYLSQQFTKYHPGVDIATGLGMPIEPVAKGVVTKAGYEFWGYGLKVEIDHPGGYHSLYAHMSKIYVQVGQTVDVTDYLGDVGMTGNTSGPHTHLEIYKDDTRINPLTVLPEIRKFPKPQDFEAKDSPIIDSIVESTQSAQVATSEAVLKPRYYPTPTPKPLSPEDVSLDQAPTQPLFDSLEISPENTTPITSEDGQKLTEKLVKPQDTTKQVTADSFQGGRYVQVSTVPLLNSPKQKSVTADLSIQTAKNMDINLLLNQKKSTPVQKKVVTSPLTLLPL